MTATPESAWLEVSMRVLPEAAEAVSEVLCRYAPQGVAIDMGEHLEDAHALVTVKAYLIQDTEIAARRQQVEAAMGHLRHIWPTIPAPTFRTIYDEDWTAGWKESIPVLHIGERVVIKPSWRTYQPAAGEVLLEMDPGLAFGTGLHPTTQLCIQALERLGVAGARVLDLGTGTGILALVAAKLGAAEVVAVDMDAQAVEVTRRNARVNRVADVVHPRHGSIEAASGTYDVVLANILAPVIVGLAADLAARLRVGGTLIASGILVGEQAEEVRAALARHGARVTEVQQQEEWAAVWAEKQNLA